MLGLWPWLRAQFVERLCPSFNVACDGQAAFSVIPHIEGRGGSFPRFHFDSRRDFDEHSQRAIISTTETGLLEVLEDARRKETEWIATDELSEDNFRRLIGKNLPVHEFSEDIRSHIHTVRSRDLFFFQGLSKDRDNMLLDGCAHRSPKHKTLYKSQGIV